MDGRTSLVALAMLLCIALSDAGESYVRWGRSVCPDGAHKIYDGLMAGRHYAGVGNGGNYLCVANQASFVRAVAGDQVDSANLMWHGLLHGIEFQIIDQYKNLFLLDNLPAGQGLNNQDVVCARCYVPDARDQFMLAGRPDCGDSGYTLQYKGFLVSEANYSGRQPAEYVCVDEAPEARKGGEAYNKQGPIYPVEIGCGSLPCDNYTDKLELTCAVCTW